MKVKNVLTLLLVLCLSVNMLLSAGAKKVYASDAIETATVSENPTETEATTGSNGGAVIRESVTADDTTSSTTNPYKDCKLSDDRFYYKKSTVFSDGAAIANYAGEEKYVIVPDEIGNMPVVQLTITDCETMEELEIPNTVKLIEDLSGNKNLTTIHFPSTIDMIDSWFSGDTSIKHLYIPENVSYISPDAFVTTDASGKTVDITGIVVHGVAESYAQEYAESKGYEFVEYEFATEAEETATPETSTWSYNVLEDWTAQVTGYTGEISSTFSVPDTINDYVVSSISKAAFKSKLSDCRILILPEGLTSIDLEAFADNGIETVYFSGTSLTSIGSYAFSGCTNLQSVTIPDGVTEIGYGAFEGCENLESITIPASVENIKADAFEGCKKLKNIIVESGSYADRYFNGGDEETETPASGEPEQTTVNPQKSDGWVSVLLIFVIILLAAVVVVFILYKRETFPQLNAIMDKLFAGDGQEVPQKVTNGKFHEWKDLQKGRDDISEGDEVKASDPTDNFVETMESQESAITAEEIEAIATETPQEKQLGNEV